MPEKHNRILLCPENRERDKKEESGREGGYKKTESKSFSHTLLVFSFGGSVDSLDRRSANGRERRRLCVLQGTFEDPREGSEGDSAEDAVT